MIAYIHGKLAAGGTGWVVIDVQGIGYHIHVPLTTKLPGIGQEVKLHTHMAVREDGIQFYGFSGEEQRDCFLALLDVAGVGPKMALAVVSHLPPENLRLVIAGEDVNQLVKVPGVGKKTAQRILLELKDKLPGPVALSGETAASDGTVPQGQDEDAVVALLSLGYSQSEARDAVRKAQHITPAADVPALIKAALKELAPIK